MDVTKLIAIVTVLITLSIASERLVEIIKGLFPKLSQENLEGADEGRRKAKISLLAVICGLITAALSSKLLEKTIEQLAGIKPDQDVGAYILIIVALGLLASGGSAFWNSILEYLLKIKDLKVQGVKKEKVEAEKAESLKEIEIEKAKELKELEVKKVEGLTAIELQKARG